MSTNFTPDSAAWLNHYQRMIDGGNSAHNTYVLKRVTNTPSPSLNGNSTRVETPPVISETEADVRQAGEEQKRAAGEESVLIDGKPSKIKTAHSLEPKQLSKKRKTAIYEEDTDALHII